MTAYPPRDRSSSTFGIAVQSDQPYPADPFVRFEPRALEQSIPDRFRRTAERWPQRLALKSATRQLTYAELNSSCTRFAHALLESLGGGEEPVALLLDQGVPLISAMLGVLATGKILVPLDPSFPLERLDYMVRDSGARLIVTSARHVPVAQSLCANGRRILDVETQPSRAINASALATASADSLASITYTSGSTGQPKGVIQNHRNLLHTVMNYTNVFRVCASDRVASFTPPASVALLWLGLLSLLNGASYFPINVKEQPLSSIANWIDEQQVSVLSAMPPVYRVVMNSLPSDFRFAHCRLVGMGGDTVQANDVELFRRHFTSDCVLSPGLGSTEAGRLTHYLMDARAVLPGGIVPVGYPAEGLEVMLLDEDGREVGDHEIGEIVIRSEFLSPGYWRQPELTQRSFLADPGGSKKRLYFSGDLARRLDDGCLVHMGRKDRQVKIRGHRVELTEVEAALVGIPGIAEAVAVGHPDSDGEKRIVAYVVAATQPATSIADLREALSARLPQHMVPSKFIMLDALPLTLMGKVDRGALPSPSATRSGLSTAYAPPRSPVEIALANIWAEVLGLDRIGIDDAFLELGGDSLLAMRIASRINDQFQTTLPVSAVFMAATIAVLAGELDAALQNRGRVS